MTHVVVDSSPPDGGRGGLNGGLDADDQVGQVSVGGGELVLLLQDEPGQGHAVCVQGSHREATAKKQIRF